MIHCLIIGNKERVQYYLKLIAQINYFGERETLNLENNEIVPSDLNLKQYDALIIVSALQGIEQLLNKAIKLNTNIYFTEQTSFTPEILDHLEQLHNESHNLLYPEFLELQHPLMQGFIKPNNSHLKFTYSKSIVSRRQIRPTLLSTLYFNTLLSPMEVKKIDINSSTTTNEGRPSISLSFKMYDGSLSHIILNMDNKQKHHLTIEVQKGKYFFNFAENYLENSHGIQFKSKKITINELITKTLESFALCIILNHKPQFSFHHYTLSFKILTKIENILGNSF
jgi:hypothetical protein